MHAVCLFVCVFVFVCVGCGTPASPEVSPPNWKLRQQTERAAAKQTGLIKTSGEVLPVDATCLWLAWQQPGELRRVAACNRVIETKTHSITHTNTHTQQVIDHTEGWAAEGWGQERYIILMHCVHLMVRTITHTQIPGSEHVWIWWTALQSANTPLIDLYRPNCNV